MKTIMIVPELPCKNCHKYEPNACVKCFNKNGKKEQVPESWEELKELVKNNIFEDDRNGVKIGEMIKVEYILIDGKSFMPYGYILDEDNNEFAKNLTPAQMWNIIKSLIGEE